MAMVPLSHEYRAAFLALCRTAAEFPWESPFVRSDQWSFSWYDPILLGGSYRLSEPVALI